MENLDRSDMCYLETEYVLDLPYPDGDGCAGHEAANDSVTKELHQPTLLTRNQTNVLIKTMILRNKIKKKV